LLITVLAIIGKLVGCSLPALAVGFNGRGALRLGWGMLPRGEVALIVAGVGLASGVVGDSVFGVAVLMTVVTTLMAPPLLVWSFRDPRPGVRRFEAPPAEGMEYAVEVATGIAMRFRDCFREVMVDRG